MDVGVTLNCINILSFYFILLFPIVFGCCDFCPTSDIRASTYLTSGIKASTYSTYKSQRK